jgi:2-hydroxy-3-keto-5-methylthiopentenyl-1-phosphate phosphatase
MSSPDIPSDRLLVTDFDGTMTETDFYELALDRFTPSETRYVWQRYKQRELTTFETLQAIFSSIKASPAELIAALDDLGFDAGAAAAIQRLRAAGWEVVIVSAGCDWYIQKILAKAGVSAVVHANPGEYAESGGLEMRVPSASPYLSSKTGIDKAAIVREALENYRDVAFAGNSAPDLEAARLVNDNRRFARSQLADLLDEEYRPYRRFQRWSEIAEMLLTG